MNISIPLIMSCFVVFGVYALAMIVNANKRDVLGQQLKMVDKKLENCKDKETMLALLKLRKKIRSKMDNY